MEEMDEEIRRLDEEEEEECIFTMSYADRMVLSVLQRRYKPPTPADWRYRTDFEAKIARQKSGGPDQPHKETLFDKLYAAYLAELEFSKDQQQDVDDEDEDDDWEMQEEDEGVEEVSELRSKQYKAADDGGTMNSEFHNTEVTSNPTDKVIITQTMRPKSAMKPSGKQRSLNPSVSIKSTGRVSTMSDRSGSLKSQVSPKRGASLSASRSKEASLVSMRSSRSMRANFSAAAPLSPVQGLQGISTIDTADDLPANSNQSPPALTASTQTNNEAHQTTSNAQPTSMKRGVSVRQVQEISRKDLFGKYLAGNRKAAEGRSFQQSAVSMQFLNDFVYRLHQASVNSASLTNEQVLIAHILPQSAQRGLSYVDSGLVLPEDVSTPTYVVLQRWGGRFIEMVDALRHFSAGVPPDKIFFWIDMFAVNYHAKPGGLGNRPATTIRNLAKSGPNTATTVGGSQRNMVLITEDRHWLTPTRMDSILETSTSGLIVIMDEKAPIAWPLNQPWPLYLIYRTLADKGWPAVQLLARSRGCTLSSVHRNTKINLMEAMVDAQASGAAAVAAVAAALSVDPAADVLPPRTAAPPVLLRHIKENVDGGVPGLEEMLQLAIWLDPQGDFRSEVRQLLRSCNSSVMADGLIEIEPETEPLKPGLDPPRWMNLEKYNQWLKLSQYELSYKCFGICGPAGSGKSVISAALIASSEDHSHLSAWYICQSSQQRRSSPLGLLCTLAYQLALKYPPLMSFLTESLAAYAPLHHLADKISLALRLLLRAPLLELAEQGLVPEEGIVILLDGLEEVGSRGDGADSQHMIMLREELHKLPA
ncbi:hypothetical protein CEUSTIGMA_g8996.t1 [Chlamydomonas eustigma]|uniref:Nephrocystin 3-like N-terminal domain-containing protein n=1 Tax=Chlamydomonas eustigma TaxID=1157962 RepID=A0A250XER5_9CHLO|nr:hypothetical protein CEUSTIGMA_g8996.t1 [Chlamydomonas eustigma]|eukprot:GAX81568.1 hypothetical protein CEUSTIGMA_g8996.t1 [Chlamydomonas eustigma]